ncbi:MAG: PIN domain-containing protein [Candidatus Dadabacteria bacterium]|nr:PIN domain-containing protein [Candidatus Dadabacteria bacterium]NIV41898.1 PIN domain-containing protein [Candidatus Dadabacteria bacterium]NIX14625.1 PIN domain-containing protein [Candidatus Dadabacteria bacterium]
MKVYIDTDVILDLLLKRQTFHKDAEQLFDNIAKKRLTAYTTPVSIANVYYIINSINKVKYPRNIIKKLRLLLKIIPMDEFCIDNALSSEIKDFEDSLQYYTCVKNGIDHIVTRNKKDYKRAKVPVSTHKEINQIISVI